MRVFFPKSLSNHTDLNYTTSGHRLVHLDSRLQSQHPQDLLGPHAALLGSSVEQGSEGYSIVLLTCRRPHKPLPVAFASLLRWQDVHGVMDSVSDR